MAIIRDACARDEDYSDIEIELNHKSIQTYNTNSGHVDRFWVRDYICDSDRVWATKEPEVVIWVDDGRWEFDILRGNPNKAHPAGVGSRRMDNSEWIDNIVRTEFIGGHDRVWILYDQQQIDGYDGVAMRLIPGSQPVD